MYSIDIFFFFMVKREAGSSAHEPVTRQVPVRYDIRFLGVPTSTLWSRVPCEESSINQVTRPVRQKQVTSQSMTQTNNKQICLSYKVNDYRIITMTGAGTAETAALAALESRLKDLTQLRDQVQVNLSNVK
jgi:hypothetical protein